MHYHKLIDNVLGSDARKDWRVNSDSKKSIAFYIADVDLRIEWGNGEMIDDPRAFGFSLENFDFYNATIYSVHLIYRSTLIEMSNVIFLEEKNSYIPLPTPGTTEVQELLFKFAQIIDGGGERLARIMTEIGLRVKS